MFLLVFTTSLQTAGDMTADLCVDICYFYNLKTCHTDGAHATNVYITKQGSVSIYGSHHSGCHF